MVHTSSGASHIAGRVVPCPDVMAHEDDASPAPTSSPTPIRTTLDALAAVGSRAPPRPRRRAVRRGRPARRAVRRDARAARDRHRQPDRPPRERRRADGARRPVRRAGHARRPAALGDGPGARAVERAADPVRAGAEDVRRATRSCCGTSPACSPSGCGRWTRRSPTRCSSTSPAAPPSGCSSWPTAATSSLLPVTQEELAGMVGASRERVNKAIASFIRLGWLEQRDRPYRSPSATASSSAPAELAATRGRRRRSCDGRRARGGRGSGTCSRRRRTRRPSSAPRRASPRR